MNSVVVEALSMAYGYLLTKYEHDRETCASLMHALISMALVEGAPGLSLSDNKDYENAKSMPYEMLQEKLSCLNEKTNARKKKGVYYTPTDVVDFIVTNAINMYYKKWDDSKITNSLEDGIPIEHLWSTLSFFDPTCGAGEFLIGVLRQKIRCLKATGARLSKEAALAIIDTINGNDVNPDSCAISRIRLFLELEHDSNLATAIMCCEGIIQSVSEIDFVNLPTSYSKKYDIVLGNPPYVEDKEYGPHEDKYGNIYCNVLANSNRCLSERGVLGFIVPLSYISTPRMKRIRDELSASLSKQCILSFADRPDCLFTQVHQKLCILLAGESSEPAVFTSSYTHWYKTERDSLFESIPIVNNPFILSGCIPKLGNERDLSIFTKVYDSKQPRLFDISRLGKNTICVNRRETFWMKVFRKSMEHPEFKEFHFESQEDAAFAYCLLSSSLFWWYWISVSDCWHVSRTLNDFRMPKNRGAEEFVSLASELEQKLEQTKKYVGTKQTKYEYKHSYCVNVIHQIDDRVNALYGLSGEESEYIKSYALRYRVSKGGES